MTGLLADDDIDDDIGRLPKKGKRVKGAYRDRHRRPASDSLAAAPDDDFAEQSHAFIADVALDGGRVDLRRAPDPLEETATASIAATADKLVGIVTTAGPSVGAVAQSSNDDDGTMAPAVAATLQVVPAEDTPQRHGAEQASLVENPTAGIDRIV